MKHSQLQHDIDTEQKAVANKWKNFSTTGTSKAKAFGAFTKKSIFATPDDPSGKVGVGTCNVGGKAMTDYVRQGKWQFDPTRQGEE